MSFADNRWMGFISRGNYYTLLLTGNGATINLAQPPNSDSRS
jgi:hypothetical protein